ncbi:LytTR family DNA-binding domain-containing protein [Pedobacter sp. Du54]|uniref:LytR/AlgR family response regulator transcription factor n=1 Tax=Pedobacter anseongensis TaxID=3133439 RepID=UPI0030B69F06
MAFTLPSQQQTITKFVRKHAVKSILLSALLICLLVCVQDYLQASLLHQGYFFSESLLFKSFLLPTIPIFLLLWKNRSRFAHARWTLIAIPPIASAIHLLAYTLIIYLVSSAAFEHTYSFSSVWQRSIAEDLFKYILVYLIVAIVVFTNRASMKVPIASRLIIQNGKESISVSFSEILWISTDHPYIAIHTRNRRYLSNITLKGIEAKLDPAEFMRIHRGIIISLQQVESYRSRLNGDYDVKLKCGATVRASRRYSKRLRNELSHYSV